jgi:hypothetical protein
MLDMNGAIILQEIVGLFAAAASLSSGLNSPCLLQQASTSSTSQKQTLAWHVNGAGSSRGSLAEAYAVCPSTGCKITLDADLVINTPQSLRILPGKALVLDQNGFMIHCSIKSGTCITVYPAKSTRQMFVWKDGTIDGTGAGAGTTGVVIQDGVDVHVGPLHIANFAQTGSTGLVLSNIEDSDVNATSEQNYNGVVLENSTNNNDLRLRINDGGATSRVSSSLTGVALSIQGSGGNRIHGLVQSNKGTQTVLLGGAGSNFNKFDSVWFENNGDRTAHSRLISFQTDPKSWVVNTKFDSCNISAGSLGSLGSIFSAANQSTVYGILMENNYTIGYAAFADKTFDGTRAFTGINENDTVSGSSAFYGASVSQFGIHTQPR